LIYSALQNRSEMREVQYRLRINEHEAHAALLEMLPGVQIFASTNFDSNSFLLHNDWLGWGAKASWSLIKAFQYPARRAVVEAQDRLLDQRALSVTMAIMTQVYASRARYFYIVRELESAKAYHETQRELVRHIRREHGADRVSEQTLLREELNDAVGELKLAIAWASMQSAHATVLASIGVDPVAPGGTHGWGPTAIAVVEK
jgi:predicted small metal-binding protein